MIGRELPTWGEHFRRCAWFAGQLALAIAVCALAGAAIGAILGLCFTGRPAAAAALFVLAAAAVVVGTRWVQ